MVVEAQRLHREHDVRAAEQNAAVGPYLGTARHEVLVTDERAEAGPGLYGDRATGTDESPDRLRHDGNPVLAFGELLGHDHTHETNLGRTRATHGPDAHKPVASNPQSR